MPQPGPSLEHLDKDRAFLTKGGVFTDSMIDAYIELEDGEVTRFRMACILSSTTCTTAVIACLGDQQKGGFKPPFSWNLCFFTPPQEFASVASVYKPSVQRWAALLDGDEQRLGILQGNPLHVRARNYEKTLIPCGSLPPCPWPAFRASPNHSLRQ